MFSMPFHHVHDLKFQDRLVDSKMLVEFKAVAVVFLLTDGLAANRKPSKLDDKVGHIIMKVDVIVFRG